MTSSTPMSPTFLFVDLPLKTFVGIDLLSFSSSPNFRGIKKIPRGIHFLYGGSDASLAIRHGFWLNLNVPRVLVWQWNADEESLQQTPQSSPSYQTAIASLPSLWDNGLIDYTALAEATGDKQTQQDSDIQSDLLEWTTLTSHISQAHLSGILPPSTWAISSISSSPQDTETIPGLAPGEITSTFTDLNETPLNFLHIDLKHTWRSGALGRERTEGARDRSWYLQHLISQTASDGDREVGASRIVGEMQLCFLMILTLANYSCLEQWKRLLNVLLTCRSALGEIEGYFAEVVRVLRVQIGHCEDVEGGIFEFSEEGAGGWLRGLLRGFKEAVGEVLGGKGRVAEEVSELEDLLRERYGWEVDAALLRRGVVELEDGERVEMTMEGADEEEEMGEYAPVVVET